MREKVKQASLLAGTPAVRRDTVQGGERGIRVVEALLGNGYAAAIDVVGRHPRRRLLRRNPLGLNQDLYRDCSLVGNFYPKAIAYSLTISAAFRCQFGNFLEIPFISFARAKGLLRGSANPCPRRNVNC